MYYKTTHFYLYKYIKIIKKHSTVNNKIVRYKKLGIPESFKVLIILLKLY